MVKGIEDGLGVEGLGKSDGKRQVVDTVAVSSSRKK
jgi:hypothetical protein